MLSDGEAPVHRRMPPRRPRARPKARDGTPTRVRSTAHVAGFTALRGAVNFAVQVAIAARFGAGPQTDAYFVVVGSALLMVDIVIGVLTFSALPQLVRLRQREGDQAELEVEATSLLLWAGILMLAAASLFLSAPLVVKLLAPGFSSATTSFAAELLRFSIPGILLYTYALLLGLGLQVRGRFLSTAAAPVLPLLGSLASIVMLSGDTNLKSVMLGFTGGAAIALLVQLFYWKSTVDGYVRTLGLRDGRLRRSMGPLIPVGVALGASVFLPIALRLSASDLETGSVAALGFAGQLVAIPVALLTTPVGTVIFPRLAQLMQLGNFRPGSDLLCEALLVVSLASSLVGAFMVGLSEPLVDVLYGRGSFTSRDVDLTADALRWLGAGLLTVSACSLLGRAFAAAGRVKTFAGIWLLTLAGFVGGWVLVNPSDVATLAALYSGAYSLQALLLLGIARRHGLSITLVAAAKSVFRILCSGVLAAGASWYCFGLISGHLSGAAWQAGALALALTAGGVAFLGSTFAMGGLEASTLRRQSMRIVLLRRPKGPPQ